MYTPNGVGVHARVLSSSSGVNSTRHIDVTSERIPIPRWGRCRMYTLFGVYKRIYTHKSIVALRYIYIYIYQE